MATPRLGLVVEDKPTELSCMWLLMEFISMTSLLAYTRISSHGMLT